MSAPLFAVFGFFMAAGALAWFCDWYTKRHPRNRWVSRKGLPRPSKDSVRYMTPGSL